MKIERAYDFITRTQTLRLTLAGREIEALKDGDGYVEDFTAELMGSLGFEKQRTRVVLVPARIRGEA